MQLNLIPSNSYNWFLEKNNQIEIQENLMIFIEKPDIKELNIQIDILKNMFKEYDFKLELFSKFDQTGFHEDPYNFTYGNDYFNFTINSDSNGVVNDFTLNGFPENIKEKEVLKKILLQLGLKYNCMFIDWDEYLFNKNIKSYNLTINDDIERMVNDLYANNAM